MVKSHDDPSTITKTHIASFDYWLYNMILVPMILFRTIISSNNLRIEFHVSCGQYKQNNVRSLRQAYHITIIVGIS